MKEKNQEKEDVLIVGFGASCLNLKALLSSKINHKVSFRFLDSLDPNKIKRILSGLDLTTTKTYIISKSGSTNETNMLAKYLIDKGLKSPNVLCAFEDSNLAKLVSNIDHKWIKLDQKISGRFSILTRPFLNIAKLAGIDTAKILEGSKSVKDSEVTKLAKEFIHNYNMGKGDYVVMLYNIQLKGLFMWVRQIVAESTGKDGFGITPILSECSMDEHSQLQLYLDGHDDKFYHVISADFGGNQGDLGEIASMQISHAKKALSLLESKGRNATHIHFNKIDEHLIGWYIQLYMKVMKLIADEIGFDPYNQPSVEQLKEKSNEN